MADLISRAAAIDAIAIEFDECGIEYGPNEVVHRATCELKNLPAVDAARVVHGRWVYEHGDPAMIPCSVCGYQVFRHNNTHYCPNCGAMMDGEANG